MAGAATPVTGSRSAIAAGSSTTPGVGSESQTHMAHKAKRTEHSGGKNGGGYYGKRVAAKHESNRVRRSEDRRLAREGRKDA